MPTSTLNVMVTADHPVPVEPLGGTATVLNVSGGTLYYADNPQVSSSNNQGSLTAGQSQSFSGQAWVRSASLSAVQMTVSTQAAVVLAKFQVLSRPGSLVAETSSTRLLFPASVTISTVTAAVNTAPTGASIIVDVLKNGSTVWATNPANRPTIAASAFSSAAAVPDNAAINAGDYLLIQIVQVGSTIAGADLTVSIAYS